MIYIYRRKSSTGARSLSDHLAQCRRIFDLTRYPGRPEDVLVCWGEAITPPPPGGHILNAQSIRSKYQDALILRRAGVPTIEVSERRPSATPQVDPFVNAHEEARAAAEVFSGIRGPIRGPVYSGAVEELIRMVTTARQVASQPPPPAIQQEWLPRLNNHVGGNDLMDPPDQPQYFSKKLNLIEEYRVHSFLGRSIRAGIKRPREGYVMANSLAPVGARQAHPWIRSYDGGWMISYDGVSARQAHRDLAHSAVGALGLQFGAVDIGVQADGTSIVLEVNRAPGLEGGTVEAYATAIQRWIQEGYPEMLPVSPTAARRAA